MGRSIMISLLFSVLSSLDLPHCRFLQDFVRVIATACPCYLLCQVWQIWACFLALCSTQTVMQVPPHGVQSCNCHCHPFAACTVEVTICFNRQIVSALTWNSRALLHSRHPADCILPILVTKPCKRCENMRLASAALFMSPASLSEKRQIYGENRFLWRMSSTTSCEGEPWPSWIRPAPTRMIGWFLCHSVAATVSWASWAGVDFDSFWGGTMWNSRQTREVEWQIRCRVCETVWDIETACSALDVLLVQLKSHHHCSNQYFGQCLPSIGTKFSRFKMVRNGFLRTAHMCICMLGSGEAGWDLGLNVFFLLAYLFFWKRPAKYVIIITRTQIHIDLSYIDPPLRVLNYLLK